MKYNHQNLTELSKEAMIGTEGGNFWVDAYNTYEGLRHALKPWVELPDLLAED